MNFPTDIKLHSPFDSLDKYKGNVRFCMKFKMKSTVWENEKRLIPMFTRFKYSGTLFTAIS